MAIGLGAGLVVAGLLGAGGSVAGGLLGQASDSPGNRILPSWDPYSDFSANASAIDALGQIGFARPDLLFNSGPLNELISRINSSTADEKIKRRALIELNAIANGADFGTLDPEAAELIEGRYSLELQDVLSRFGLNQFDIPDIADRQNQYDNEIKQLVNQFGPLQKKVVLDRLKANADVSSLLSGGLDGNSRLTRLLSAKIKSDTREGLERARERALLEGQFGGFNPASRLENIDRLESTLDVDADLAAINQSILMAAQISSALNQGTAASQGQSGLSAQGSLGALGIAANQASAANALQQNIAINNADSLANGVAGAFGSIGNAFGAYGMLNGGVGSTSPGAASSTSTWPNTINGIANNGFYGYGW